jgi:hypothetical protein
MKTYQIIHDITLDGDGPIFVQARSERHALKVWARLCGTRAKGIQRVRGVATFALIAGTRAQAIEASPSAAAEQRIKMITDHGAAYLRSDYVGNDGAKDDEAEEQRIGSPHRTASPDANADSLRRDP